MFALTLLSSLLAVTAMAAPATRGISARAGGFPNMPGDNASCAKMGELCANQIASGGAPNDPFGVSKECAISAICTTYYTGSYTVDVWINIYYAPPHPSAASAPRLSQNVFNNLVAPGSSQVTEQSFIDAYYSSLAASNGPWPDVAYVKNVWASIAHWTGFCTTKSVPYGNLADWFQYSSTNTVAGSCEGAVTSAPPSETLSSVSPSRTTTSVVPSSTLTPTPTPTPSPPATTPDNGSCFKIYQLCEQDLFTQRDTVKNNLLGISKACTLAATCYDGTVDAFLGQAYATVFHSNLPYQSAQSPRFPQNLYNTLVSSGSAIATQQSYIDSYYSLLATVGGPYPDVSYVIGNWAKIAAWTGFCATKNIPYQNLADWFQFSSTVSAPRTC